METIYKYELYADDKQSVEMPKGSEILSVQNQHEKISLWALVDTEKAKEFRTIEIFGTGNPIPVDMGIDRKFISTFQMRDGNIVFHAFERIN